jgi:hypothetical protein
VPYQAGRGGCLLGGPEVVARISSNIVRLLGAKKTRVLYIGLAAMEEEQDIGERIRKKTRGLEARLVSG